jgi:hypothetical protein
MLLSMIKQDVDNNKGLAALILMLNWPIKLFQLFPKGELPMLSTLIQWYRLPNGELIYMN